MSRYIPLPDLAAAIRHAQVEDAIRTFKIIATAVVHAYEMKKATGEEWTDPRSLRHLRAKVNELEHGLQGELSRDPIMGPHLLTPFQTKVTLELIYLNVEKIAGHPNSYMFEQEGDVVTAAEHWLINCTIQLECDREGHLRRRWLGYLQEQPTYDPLEEAEDRFARLVRLFEEKVSPTNCPGLVQMIHRLHFVECFRSIKEMHLLYAFFQLGATAANVWMHIWQIHGVQRGQPLPLDDEHVEEALFNIQDSFYKGIGAWQSEIPRQVREDFAVHNFGGEFLFLLNYVFPNIIAPAGSTIREDMFGWEMHQYILRCATSAEVDPRGWIALNLNLERMNPAPQNGSSAFYEPHQPLIRFYIPSLDREVVEPKDVELEVYGPLIHVDDVAEPGYPSMDDICTICQCEFDTAGSHIKKDSCSKLNLCEHMFHRDCLHEFLNAAHVDEVKCCNCRTIICDARPRRAKEA